MKSRMSQMNNIYNRYYCSLVYLGYIFLEKNTVHVSSLSVTPRTIAGHVRLPFHGAISRPSDYKQHCNVCIKKSIKSRLSSSFLDLESDTQIENDQDNGIIDHEQFIELLEMEDAMKYEENGNDLIKTHLTNEESSPILNKVWQSRLMVLFAAALYGTNFTAIKILDENIPTSVGPVLRFALAAFVTLPFVFIGKETSDEEFDGASSSKDLSRFDKSYGAIIGGMEIGIWNTIGYLSQAKALETIPASVCAFICSLAVVTVPFLDFLSGKKLSSRKIIGAAMAVLGVAFLELDGLSDSLDANTSLISVGTLFSLIQPVAFGLGFWRMEHYARKHPSEGMKVTVSQVTSIATLSMCTLIATSGMEGIPNISQVTLWLTNPTILLAILWTGCVTTALTIFIETQALKVLSAAETTMLYSFEPLFGAAFASFVLEVIIRFVSLLKLMTRMYIFVIISLCFTLPSVQSFGSAYISGVGTVLSSSSIRDGTHLFSFKPKVLQSNKFKMEHISSAKSDALDESSIAEMLRQNIELDSLLDGSRDQLVDTVPLVKITTENAQSSMIPFLSPLWQARFLLLLSASLYGTNFTFVKILNDNVPESVGTSLRFALASLATLPWLLQRSQNKDDNVSQYVEPTLPFEGSNPIIGGFEVGIWNSIGYLAQAAGLETTPASTSAFLCSLAVVTVPILDYFAGKKLQMRQIIGACLAAIGVACLELDGLDGLVMSKNDLLSLVQPVVFGMGFWRMEHYMRKFPKHAKTLTAAQLSAIFLSSLSSFFLTCRGEIPNSSQFIVWLENPTVLQSIAWTGLITTALTVYMETIALKILSAAETTILFSTEPIFGSVCASVVLGETFGATGYVGGAMILAGCLYSNIGPNLVPLLSAKSSKSN